MFYILFVQFLYAGTCLTGSVFILTPFQYFIVDTCQDVSEKYCTDFPKLYIPGQKNILFNKKSFLFKLLHGVLTSLLLYFLPYGVFQKASSQGGIDFGDMEFVATTIGCTLVITVNLQVYTLTY